MFAPIILLRNHPCLVRTQGFDDVTNLHHRNLGIVMNQATIVFQKYQHRPYPAVIAKRSIGTLSYLLGTVRLQTFLGDIHRWKLLFSRRTKRWVRRLR